jgi:hypothetical protein
MLVLATACQAQPGTRPEILVLGTYHMANPGHDLHNTKADDVLTPTRQREIAQIVEVLKKFRPTKIAIEADPGSPRLTQQYADYLAGKYTLTANETNQIGYRLAKELGHKAIYGVDEEAEFPYQRVMNYAKANGREKEFNALGAVWETLSAEQGVFMKSHTILDTLEFMNSDAAAANGVASYFGYASLGEPGEYAGPDLLAAWYQRNIRIYCNIRKLVESPNDRILVIYGAGHLGWLQQDVANDPSVKLRKLAEFTETK